MKTNYFFVIASFVLNLIIFLLSILLVSVEIQNHNLLNQNTLLILENRKVESDNIEILQKLSAVVDYHLQQDLELSKPKEIPAKQNTSGSGGN